MSPIEAVYLIAGVCAFFAFAITLAWADWYTHRPAEKPAGPPAVVRGKTVPG